MTTTWTSETKGTGAYADVDGLNLYYETHGSGRPMAGESNVFGIYN